MEVWTFKLRCCGWNFDRNAQNSGQKIRQLFDEIIKAILWHSKHAWFLIFLAYVKIQSFLANELSIILLVQ